MELFTVDELAQLLKMKPRGVHRLCREGKLEYVEVSRKERRFTPAQVEAFIQSRTVSGATPKRVDTSPRVRVTSPKYTHSGGGGASSLTEVSAKALREEMRRWH